MHRRFRSDLLQEFDIILVVLHGRYRIPPVQYIPEDVEP